MQSNRRRYLVFGLLALAWWLVAAWQVEEHLRVVEAAKSDLRNRSRDIASTLGAVTRALKFRSAVFQDRLEPVLNELVSTHTNVIVRPSDLLALGLLNIEGNPVVTAGDTNLLAHDISAEGEYWSEKFVTFVLPVAGATVSPEGTNPTVVLPPFREMTNALPRDRDFFRRERPPGDSNAAGLPPAGTNPLPPTTNAAGELENPPPRDDGARPPDGGERPRGRGRPPWIRLMSESDFKALAARRELHGLVLVMSTDNYRAVCTSDWWLRAVIAFFAGISAFGAALAWRNMGRNTELQIRLVRASEQNSHLKELNVAAAGLAHETRNPLNIIRGQAQMLARASGASADAQEKSRIIIGETDKVTAQLTEFINYSRPREVRRARVSPLAIASEVVRTLAFDLEEKKLRVEVGGEPLSIEADEQLLRQVVFNLLLNAIQATGENGRIQILLSRADKTNAVLEVRDDGSGVPPENRREIFKPYFTTHQKGTGLGLAVVQQIVHAHGWEIECLANESRGAVFRITQLKTAA
jgi:signal transduction histidine kinase